VYLLQTGGTAIIDESVTCACVCVFVCACVCRWQHNSSDGCSSLQLLVDDFSINQIRFSAADAFGSEEYGGNVTVSECPAGTVASGVYGRAAPTGSRGRYIFSLGVKCRTGEADCFH
jgi:hypothetical protein